MNQQIKLGSIVKCKQCALNLDYAVIRINNDCYHLVEYRLLREFNSRDGLPINEIKCGIENIYNG